MTAPPHTFADDLSPAPLSTEAAGARILLFERVGSTNEEALRIGGDGTVVAADEQTAGRGQRGAAWLSQPGLGLWFSLCLEPAPPGLPFAAPLAVRDAVKSLCPTSGQLQVKWPNDLLLNGRKFCGILAETRGTRTAVGIGLNVRHGDADFPVVLGGRATSLLLATGTAPPRGRLLQAILTSLDAYIVRLRAGRADELRREWERACAVRGRRIHAPEMEGTVLGVSAQGGLIVETDEGKHEISLGTHVELL